MTIIYYYYSRYTFNRGKPAYCVGRIKQWLVCSLFELLKVELLELLYAHPRVQLKLDPFVPVVVIVVISMLWPSIEAIRQLLSLCIAVDGRRCSVGVQVACRMGILERLKIE